MEKYFSYAVIVSMKWSLFLLLGVAFIACDKEESMEKPPSKIEVEYSPEKQDSILAQKAGVSYGLMEKALRFRAELRGKEGYRSGVYVYDSKSITTYIDKPEQLAARLALLGLKDVYLSASKGAMDGTNLKKHSWLKRFNKEAHQLGLSVWALRLATYDAFVSDALIKEECQRIRQFNLSVDSSEGFDAVAADWEPHVLKKNGADTPSGLDLFWDSNNHYGKGAQNDLLLKRTLEMLALAKDELSGLPLNEAIHYMYQNNFDAQRLSYGSTLQFLESCHYVTVMCYADTKEKIWQRGTSPLQSAKTKSKSVGICIKTSLNTYGDGGDTSTSLQPKGWDYLLQAIQYFYSEGKITPAFRGVDFFEFEGLEQMWTQTKI